MLGTPSFRLALGLWFMICGSVGYERYVSEGRIDAALFDAALQVAGVVLVWRSVQALWDALAQKEPDGNG
jgi:hypothetical protein